MAAVRVIVVLLATGLLAACSDSPSEPAYTVGGTVAGLSSTGLVLQNNCGNNLAIATSGNFTFTTAIASGSPYNVTVLTDPAVQNCTVTNGAGTAAKVNITNVTVTCPIVFAQHEVVTASATTGAVGTLGTISAICPVDKSVLSGAYTSVSGGEVWRVWRNYPVEAGVQVGDRGWSVDFTSVVAGQTVSAFALCGFAPI